MLGKQRDERRRQQWQEQNDPGKQLLGSSGLQFHRGQIFDMGGLALAIEGHDQRQAHRDFRRRHRDDKKDQDLAVEVVVEPREGDQRQIARR